MRYSQNWKVKLNQIYIKKNTVSTEMSMQLVDINTMHLKGYWTKLYMHWNTAQKSDKIMDWICPSNLKNFDSMLTLQLG